MTGVRRYGLAFHIDPELSQGSGKHLIKSALVCEAPLDTGSHHISFSFKYALPEPMLTVARWLGASETMGVYGGVSDEAQKALSEVVERNIGDILTVSLTQFLSEAKNTLNDTATHLLLILGPPLPKVVGRFASLRIPRSLQVAWVYSFPPPAWLAVFPGWNAISRPGQHQSRLWIEDDLIVEETRVSNGIEYRIAWMNQYVTFENVHSNPWIDELFDKLVEAPWIDTSCKLPPVLSLASLYALGERRNAISDRDLQGSPLYILAAAMLNWSDSTRFSEEIEAEKNRIEELINKNPVLFPQFTEVASRGGDQIPIHNLPELIKEWPMLVKTARQPSMVGDHNHPSKEALPNAG